MTCNPTSSSHEYILAEILIGDVLKRLMDVWMEKPFTSSGHHGVLRIQR